jgi:two-component system, chemotaxis family, protein-glutamate methylesterase/glutaminase
LTTQRLISIGASSGGLEALQALVRALPTNLTAPIVVVLHSSPESPGIVGEILNRIGTVPAANAEDGERLTPGRIYVAPPDYHVIVEPGVIRLTRGPKENRFRPAIDPLFRSAASVYGPMAVGVILSGDLDDGTAGLLAIKQLGGTTVVQDPQDATFPSMPRSAMNHVQVDYCVSIAELGSLLSRLVTAPLYKDEVHEVPSEMEIENSIAREKDAIEAGVRTLGEPSSYACPECHGVLLQLSNANPLRFRCHTGHAYTVQSLVAEISEKMEEALWAAVRSFEEAAMLLRHLAANPAESQFPADTDELFRRAQDTKRRSDLIKEALRPHSKIVTNE